MCGIVGYVGTPGQSKPALGVVIDALRRMEYRGYDSAGIALLDGAGGIAVEKKAGKLDNLVAAVDAANLDKYPATTGIGHTRWATHGRPTDSNAHPHVDHQEKIAVVHNGIIENFAPLRAELEANGVEFSSETDSETVTHLLHAEYYGEGPNAGDFHASVMAVINKLEGAFTLVIAHADHPGTLIACRRSTPLVVGVGDHQMFLGSDVAAFIEHTREAVELGHDNVVTITADGYQITDFAGNPVEGHPFTIDWDLDAAEKGGYDYFMLKEIAEQPQALADTLRGHFIGGHIVLDEQRLSDDDLRQIEKIFVVACGSAYHSGLLAKYAIEHWTRVPVEIELASEFRYRDPVLGPDTLVLAISQSGETADTLEAVRHARSQKARVLAVCNTNGAQIPRESDAVLYTHAGPEIAVASTKAFLAQVIANYLVGLALAQARGTKYPDEVAATYRELEEMASKVEKVLEQTDHIRTIGRQFAGSNTILFIGRNVGYPVALEGALKLKELAYIHAEGFAAGELKHGPIALIDEGMPIVVIMPSPKGRAVLHSKMISNVKEVQARGATTIVIAEEGDDAVVPFADHIIRVPECSSLLQPLVSTVPLQMMAAEIATQRGYDVDKPRNLAKSVTVE
ncbi:glutamine--fructose-6-phosphate transaminase (isomerizing) [Lawsonella clevelandensis]|uniref:Glutamine--fructose-6-phosphate aminotransferase [isomerizing] n=1 Tax=Lawsonella clevelandensis TaxID=1528099 RepID=A0A5E3ZWM6_9ACTN|nr:glutamine--fructose-6-phosphate transaminase (isomerizing) [Lawsonella clevelandensis]ALE34428.1 glutamine--fructose-6-phosphate aminotransferase [Lawsonella clevelandensis]VHO00175.1 Glutamine--fructose-6-phosphate aminotransferase [isomerizing] [Lawsonella clevelandensis]